MTDEMRRELAEKLDQDLDAYLASREKQPYTEGWKEGEFKALKEVFNENEFKYKAFNVNALQCVIQII